MTKAAPKPNPQPLHRTLSLEAWLFRAADCGSLEACLGVASKRVWSGLHCAACVFCPDNVRDPRVAWKKASTIPDSLTSYEQQIQPLAFCDICEHWLPYPELNDRTGMCRGCQRAIAMKKWSDRKARHKAVDSKS